MNNLELMLISLRARRDAVLEYELPNSTWRLEAVLLNRQISALEEIRESKDTKLKKTMTFVDAYRNATIVESHEGVEPPAAMIRQEDALTRTRRELVDFLKTII
jgi:hypothetical protein